MPHAGTDEQQAPRDVWRACGAALCGQALRAEVAAEPGTTLERHVAAPPRAGGAAASASAMRLRVSAGATTSSTTPISIARPTPPATRICSSTSWAGMRQTDM